MTRFRVLDHAKDVMYGFAILLVWALMWLGLFFLGLKVCGA